ncbi:hypothetical protein VTP01DRAFT_9336 [Rhizomucor pusillus]|uniref:uncharacterized protein n=1 Tax=Rhizomucor pusillus TaxID=4840 RepID=UPI00374460B5
MLLLLALLCSLILTTTVSALFGQPHAGVILRDQDEKFRSGRLSGDHRCTAYPKQFPAAKVQNVGETHCGLWTGEDCTGSVYIVPAHYSIKLPQEQFGSVIC